MTNNNNKSIRKEILEALTSADHLFILLGILLNGLSTVLSFIGGHFIAGIILAVCEVALIVAYILKIL